MHNSPRSQRSVVLAPAPQPTGTNEAEDFACSLIASRQNIAPKRLIEPGPSAAQLQQIFAAAAAAPDHGEITPWRFVIVPGPKRALLAEVFSSALLDRDTAATPAQLETAREKAFRAPLLILAIARLGRADPDIRAAARLVSLGCAIQNMLLAAHAMGYGCGLTSGQAMTSPRMRELFALFDGETPVCCVNMGTVAKSKPQRIRPDPQEFVSSL